MIEKKFADDGFALVRGFFNPEETAKLLAEVTTAQTRFDSGLDRGGLVFRRFLHHGSPFLRGVIAGPKMVSLMTRVLGPDLWARRDVAAIKKPGSEEFAWHQDNGYNQLLDPYAQFWVPMSDATEANGCLWVIPGSHRRGLLPHRMKGSHFVWEGTPKGAVPIETKAGDALIFSSYLLHRSGPNHTGQDRVAYLIEFMSRRHFDPYTPPPFFMVSKNGVPDPRFVDFYEGSASLANRLRYVIPRTRRRYQIWRGRLKGMLDKARSGPHD